MWAHLCRAGEGLVCCIVWSGNTHFDDDDTFVETYGDLIGIFAQRNTPSALKSIIECVFHSIGPAVPNLDCSILASTDDDREVWVENGERNVVGMSLHGLHTALAKIVPHFDGLVVACGNEVRLVGAGVEIDVIDAFVVSFHCEIGIWGADGPHLDSAIKTGRDKCVGVLGVEGEIHDVVGVSLVRLDVLPPLVPIPSLDRHIVAAGQDNARGGVHGKTSNIVRMGFEGRHFFVGVVVEDAQLEIVRARNEPVLARDKFDTAHWDLCDLERFDDGASLVVVNIDGAVVQPGEQPWFGWMEIDALYAVRARKELFLK